MDQYYSRVCGYKLSFEPWNAIIKQGKEYTFLNLLKTKNNLIDLSIGWQLSAASLNSTFFNGIFYEKCNEI